MTDHLRVAPRQKTAINGHTVSFRDNGQGDPIVFLHDLYGSADSWGSSWSGLPGRRLIAWDMPGYGESDPWPGDRASARDYAEHCAGLLEGLDLQPAHLIGHGVGALLAVHLAASRPDRFRSLILVSPALCAQDISHHPAPSGDIARFAAEQAPRLVGPQNPPNVVREVERIIAGMSEAGYRTAAGLLEGTEMPAELSAVTLPVLVTGGDNDPLVDGAARERLMKALPNGELHTAANVGHFISLERPDRFHDIIGPLLELN